MNNLWRTAVTVLVVGSIAAIALSKPSQPTKETSVVEPEPKSAPTNQGESGAVELIASWRGDCDSSHSRSGGGASVSYKGNTSSVNGNLTGTQTVTWRADTDKFDRAEIYVDGVLVERSTKSESSFTQDATRGCLTAVLIYTK